MKNDYKYFTLFNLLQAWDALDKCQSRGVSDELRLSMIEKELDKRDIYDYDGWVLHYTAEETW